MDRQPVQGVAHLSPADIKDRLKRLHHPGQDGAAGCRARPHHSSGLLYQFVLFFFLEVDAIF